MTLRGILSSAVAMSIAFAVAAPALHAQVIGNKDQRKCLETIAKSGAKYVTGRLKELSKCADANMKETGKCDTAKRDAKLDKAETKLKDGIDKKCGDASKFPSPDLTLQLIGFPGKCQDTTGPPFTNDDLETCIFETHRDIADNLFDAQYGSNGLVAALSFEDQGNDATTAKDLGKCQKEISKNAQKFVKTVLKEVQKCRNGLQAGKTTGFLPENCANNAIEPKPKEKIDKTETKMREKIASKCTDASIALMDVCGGLLTEPLVTDCIVDAHRDACDNPDQSDPADLVDIEYRATGSCGDNITNDNAKLNAIGAPYVIALASEECDGTDDTACPGQCGGPSSDFPCLCLDIPRMRVVEDGSINGDNGWNGVAHDSAIVGGAGHIVDLYDCDGPLGPDKICTIGPSCANAPNGPCVNDADCAGGGNFCRKTGVATGPRCNEDLFTPCSDNGDCTSTLTDFCRKTPASTPIPTSAGGVSTCTFNLLEEDIVGTVNVETGSSEVHLRQIAVTQTFGAVQAQPCPRCGGWCASENVEAGSRTPCDDDSDCTASVTCILENICSFGPNANLGCRPEIPFGGTHPIFGTTSIDCPPPLAGASELDITTDPRTTGTALLPPSFTCSAFGFTGNACILGADTGKTCVVDTDCSGGGAGSCTGQCFCAAIGGVPTQPNACLSACRGGTNDYMDCAADTDCPGGGFCQPASCRHALGVCVAGSNNAGACAADSDCPDGTCGDMDTLQEGFCPQGPFDGICDVTSIKQCFSDLDCRPSSVGGSCEFCQETELCVTRPRQCFVNEGIVRQGAAGNPTRTRAAAFCIPAASITAVNTGGGFPGPGTTVGEEDIFFTGF